MKEEDIKTEIKERNACVKVQDIFKYDGSKNINFSCQDGVFAIATCGLIIFLEGG